MGLTTLGRVQPLRYSGKDPDPEAQDQLAAPEIVSSSPNHILVAAVAGQGTGQVSNPVLIGLPTMRPETRSRKEGGAFEVEHRP